MVEKVEKGKERRRCCTRGNVGREMRKENVRYLLMEMFYILKEVQYRTGEEEHVEEEGRKLRKRR